MLLKVYKLKDLKRAASNILSEIKFPSSIVFEGALGSGKTTLIREIASFLRIDRLKISSPTFNLVNEHQGKLENRRIRFNHFDLYRIEEPKELIELPFDYFFKGNYINCFEWGKNFLPTIHDFSERVYIIQIAHDNFGKEEFRIINLFQIE